MSKLDLKIEGSKCVGFLGPNGAGKTTTLKMLTDLIRPSSGEALINGANVHTQKKKALESVGTLIETPEIYSSLTPKEALMMIAELRGMPREMRGKKVQDSIDEVRMGEWADKRVGKFSKGMKQRITIASALLSDPNILLLDEPTSGLDPRGMSEVREIVKSLKRKHRLIFMSSHLLNEVQEVCDEVAMIDHGKLLVYDTLQNVTNRFTSGEAAVEVGFLNSIDDGVAEGKIRTIQGITKVEKMDSRNIRLRFSGGLEVQSRILEDIASMKLGVVSFRASASALEDVYLSLIQKTL